jgi:glycerol-3-phosphate acyltransferase PlsY
MVLILLGAVLISSSSMIKMYGVEDVRKIVDKNFGSGNNEVKTLAAIKSA